MLILPILAGLMLVMGVAGVAAFLVARSGLRAQFDEGLVSRARTFASLVVEEPGEEGQPGPIVLDYTGPLREEELGVVLRVTSDDASVVAQSSDWPEGVPVQARDAGEVYVGLQKSAPLGPARVAALGAVAQREADETYPPAAPRRHVTVEVLGRLSGVERAEGAVLTALLSGIAVATAGTGIAVWFGVRRGLAPLARLRQELAQVDVAEPEIQSTAASYPEELRPVVAVLEELLGRVRSAMERERCFTDAAAHELRTPIAELRTVVDVAERWPDPDRLRRAASEAGAIAEEMESLLEALLAAARGGDAYAAHATEPVLLLSLVRSVVERERERVPGRNLVWSVAGAPEAVWHGPRAAVLAMLRNLIRNAAEHTPDGGSVSILVGQTGSGGEFRIENGPVALAREDLVRMFEPFWRADEARSDRERRGLGLFVVDSLCRSLKLERRVELVTGQRLQVRIVGK
jgi:signal transduction histidine kinase